MLARPASNCTNERFIVIYHIFRSQSKHTQGFDVLQLSFTEVLVSSFVHIKSRRSRVDTRYVTHDISYTRSSTHGRVPLPPTDQYLSILVQHLSTTRTIHEPSQLVLWSPGRTRRLVQKRPPRPRFNHHRLQAIVTSQPIIEIPFLRKPHIWTARVPQFQDVALAASDGVAEGIAISTLVT
jgi:hypothetical protein